MLDLDKIGFYTLSNQRALTSSSTSPLQRCELILTDKCNFACPYCRGLKEGLKGDLPFEEANRILDIWFKQGLKNIRFSGGEPTLYNGLLELVARCRDNGVEHIAVSSNGSANRTVYTQLLEAGVDDFSISLDSGCCSIGDDMAGGRKGSWQKVVDNIKYLSTRTYVTVGMVFTEQNVEQCKESVLFADSLNVSDIRVIPSAQFNKALIMLSDLPETLLSKYPILNYRIKNIKNGISVRGLADSDCDRCWLGLDDMAVAQGKHFPCIIYMREGGDPIGTINDDVREVRENWIKNHNPHTDKICKGNCLDVCIAFNKVADTTKKKIKGGQENEHTSFN